MPAEAGDCGICNVRQLRAAPCDPARSQLAYARRRTAGPAVYAVNARTPRDRHWFCTENPQRHLPAAVCYDRPVSQIHFPARPSPEPIAPHSRTRGSFAMRWCSQFGGTAAEPPAITPGNVESGIAQYSAVDNVDLGHILSQPFNQPDEQPDAIPRPRRDASDGLICRESQAHHGANMRWGDWSTRTSRADHTTRRLPRHARNAPLTWEYFGAPACRSSHGAR
jgi:hypothetical protein